MCYCLWLGSGICPPRTIPLGPKIEETNQKVIERLQEIKSETPTHSHCYLSKFVKKDNIGYQDAVNAALDAGINNPKEEDNFVFFDLSSSTNVNPFWHNVRNSTIALAIWGLIIAAAFYFTKEKKRKRKRRKEEDTPLTKEDKKEPQIRNYAPNMIQKRK